MAMMQVSQSEMVQQLARLQDNFSQVVRELADTKNKQLKQQQVLKNMMDFLSTRHGLQGNHLLILLYHYMYLLLTSANTSGIKYEWFR